MNNKNMKANLEKIARRIPENTNLWPQIEARLEPRKTLMNTYRARPALAILLAILALLLVSGIAYAIGRSLGFSPTVGIVETSSLRMLAEPVVMERDGIRVTVNDAALDADHTTVRYQVEWLDPALMNENTGSNCMGTPELTSLDGVSFGQGIGAADGKGMIENGYWSRLEFPALPADQNEARLIIPCLIPILGGPLPEDWQFDLHFIPWDGTPLAPVHVVSQPTATSTPEGPQPTQAVEKYQVTFTLEQVIELSDGYIFDGKADWAEEDISPYSVSPYAAHLIDATGRTIPLDWASPQSNPVDMTESRWAFQSYEKPTAFPVTLVIDGYTYSLNASTVFHLDLGNNPQPGDVYPVNQDLQVAGHVLHIGSGLIASQPDLMVIEFDLSSDESVHGALLFDLQHTQGGGGGGGMAEPPIGPFTSRVYYQGQLPTGVVEITVMSLNIAAREPWQVTWQP